MPFKLAMPFDYAGASRINVGRTTTQTLTDANWTKVVFSTENTDNLSEYNNTTGVFTATNSGYYIIAARVMTSSYVWTAGNRYLIRCLVNGSSVVAGRYTYCQTAYTGYMDSQLTYIGYVAAGQEVQIDAFCDRGSDTVSYASQEYVKLAIHRLS